MKNKYLKCYINMTIKGPNILLYNHFNNEVVEQHIWGQQRLDFDIAPHEWFRGISSYLPEPWEWIDIYAKKADIPKWQRTGNLERFPAITMREFKKNCPGVDWNLIN